MPSPFFGTSARYGLRKLLGTSSVADIDAGFSALADDVDTKTVGYSSGLLSARPAASVRGRTYFASDAPPGGILYFDTGSTWIEIGPPPATGTFYSRALTGGTTQSLPGDNAAHAITLDADVHPANNGLWDAGASAYDVPASGLYLVSAAVRASVTNAPQELTVYVLKNGTVTLQGQASSAAAFGSIFATAQVVDVLHANAGDTIQMQAVNGGGNAVVVQGGNGTTFLTVSRIG